MALVISNARASGARAPCRCGVLSSIPGVVAPVIVTFRNFVVVNHTKALEATDGLLMAVVLLLLAAQSTADATSTMAAGAERGGIYPLLGKGTAHDLRSRNHGSCGPVRPATHLRLELLLRVVQLDAQRL